jgi:hypothetical protein
VAQLEAASKGRGSVGLVTGEPGIGKTRLVDELGRIAREQHARVVWGRCWEAGGTPAYWPFIQVLRALTLNGGAEALAKVDAGRREDLAPLFPELASARRGATAEPAQARFRTFEAVTILFQALARTPVVVLLDDLHVADLSSLHLLHFLARELRSMRVLVLGTYREQEARASRERMELLARIAREGAVFPLGRLAPADVKTLVRRELGERADEHLIFSLERSSEGNPLFLSEMLRLIAARGAPPSGVPELVPDTVRELIRARLAATAEPTRNVIEFAAVFGREFGERQLAMIANLLPSAARECLDDAGRAGLVVELGAGRWAFSHILMREVLYASIPAPLKARLHVAVARALEHGGDEGASAPAAIAHHRLLGASESGAREAVESVLSLSERGLAQFAFEDAASSLERALELLATEPDETELRARVLVLLGEACIRSGARERGKQACRAAAELYLARSEPEGVARAALAHGSEISLGDVDPSLVTLLETALEALGAGEPRLRARLQARLAAARQPAPNTFEPVELARAAISLARSIGDEETLRTVLHFALAAMVDYAEPDEIAPLCEESVALATRAGDRTHLLRAQGRLVFASLERGDLVRADVAISGYEALARELPSHLYLPDALMMRAMRAVMEGRFADADELTTRARETRDPLAAPFTRAGALLHDMARDLVEERPDRLQARLAEAPAALGFIPEVGVDYINAITALTHARLGDLDTARRHLARIPENGTMMTGEPQGQRVLAEVIAAVGDARLAALLEPRMRRMERRVTTWGRMVMICDAPVTRLLGLLVATQGRHAEAKVLLEDALTRARGMRHLALLPRLAFELGAELLHSDAGDDRTRARELLAEAERGAEVLGYACLLENIREVARPLADIPPEPKSPALTPAGADLDFKLTREGEYYSISQGGKVARLRDSTGLRLLERLIANPERDMHALELVGATSEPVDGGDAGELLDERAIAEYRRRLSDLRETVSEAESFGDEARRARAQAEIDAIADELSRGVGLGGRARRAGAAAERARVNVQRRVRDAIRRIENELPELGRHLSWAVKTGIFSSYSPRRRG